MKGDREKCLDAGMDVYIAKPLNKQELFTALERFSRSGKYMAPSDEPERIAPLDVSQGLERTGGDSALLSEMCEIFLEESVTVLEQLSRSINDENPDEIRRAAHRLKTSAGSIGGVRAYEAALAVERQIQSNRIEAISLPALRLLSEINELRNAVSDFLSA